MDYSTYRKTTLVAVLSTMEELNGICIPRQALFDAIERQHICQELLAAQERCETLAEECRTLINRTCKGPKTQKAIGALQSKVQRALATYHRLRDELAASEDQS